MALALSILSLTGCAFERDLGEDRFPCTGDRCASASADAGETAAPDAGVTIDAGTTTNSCDDAFDPCGGDPVGTWTLRSACGTGMLENELREYCDGTIVERASTVPMGGLTFNGDGTFVASQALLGDADFFIPIDCNHTTCATNALALSGFILGTVECIEETTRCRCTYSGTVFVDVRGDYTQSGATITLDPTTGPDRVIRVCVEGAGMSYDDHGTVFRATR